MHNYLIESFKITNLWGYRDIDLHFNNDVNVLIGPNASGKTTILNLLYSTLTADLRSIFSFNFQAIEIELRSFEAKSTHTIKVERDVADGFSEISIGKNRLPFKIDTVLDRRFSERHPYSERGNYSRNTLIRAATGVKPIKAEEFYDALTSLVPIVWLPVSRRLPIREYEEDRYVGAQLLESVDLHLHELLERLFHYHSGLNTQLSELYKKFEQQVLSVILYSREHDQLNLILNSMPSKLPTTTEKKQLLGAFKAAGLLDEQMRGRISEHFAAAEDVLKRIDKSGKFGWDFEDILVVPLIRRTQAMVKYARELEEDRERIFAYLRLYEKTVNSYLNDKSIEVSESGQLELTSTSSSNLNPRLLSSGEKQILILLTEALLQAENPMVYIADEPELSLHVTWQEKLLESLVTLGDNMQIIVATHSPDIVGNYQDKVIDLG